MVVLLQVGSDNIRHQGSASDNSESGGGGRDRERCVGRPNSVSIPANSAELCFVPRSCPRPRSQLLKIIQEGGDAVQPPAAARRRVERPGVGSGRAKRLPLAAVGNDVCASSGGREGKDAGGGGDRGVLRGGGGCRGQALRFQVSANTPVAAASWRPITFRVCKKTLPCRPAC